MSKLSTYKCSTFVNYVLGHSLEEYAILLSYFSSWCNRNVIQFDQNHAWIVFLKLDAVKISSQYDPIVIIYEIGHITQDLML